MAQEKEPKPPRYFDKCRCMFEMVANEKPGDAGGDVLIIFLPIGLIVDIISIPFVFYKKRKGE